MRKDLGAKPLIYPQPVLMVATYDENGNPDIMNAAWGGVGDDHQVFLCLSPEHKTTKNLLKNNEFTVSIAVEGFKAICDYLGIVSANDDPEKVLKTGLHISKSEKVNAPIVEELPLTLECKLISYEPVHCHLFGEIVGTSVDEKILTDGKVDIEKLRPLIFDIDMHNYYSVGAKQASAFSVGKEMSQEQVALGNQYYYGEGVELDIEKAVYWYTKAAENGNAEGQCLLGYCYREGIGVDKDVDRAIELFTKSAAQGFAMAKENLEALGK